MNRFNIDWFLTIALALLAGMGLAVAYSASGGDLADVRNQSIRVALGFVGMLIAAHIPPPVLSRMAPVVYIGVLAMLIWVAVSGTVGKGAQRWLDLRFIRFQPSELAKLTVPLMVAWYLSNKLLPTNFWNLLVALIIILVPFALIAEQPDLGTALLVGTAGGAALFLSGLSYRLMAALAVVGLASAPLVWHFLHDYQRLRILTLIDPQRDPLGAGYHVIQSTIAVGSGGLFGKGWLLGTQSHLHFIPESSTDFVFAVFAEEFGFFGGVALLLLYSLILLRGLAIALAGQDTFCRLLAGSLVATFFVYLFVNVGMVLGVLPVVGVPLPLVSYGGTSMVTLMLGFGCLMAIQRHRRLWSA